MAQRNKLYMVGFGLCKVFVDNKKQLTTDISFIVCQTIIETQIRQTSSTAAENFVTSTSSNKQYISSLSCVQCSPLTLIF